MSHAFDARFAPISLELPEILDRLAGCLHDARVDFDQEVMRLHSRGGVPTVMSMTTDSVASLEAVAEHAKSWWGVSLYCISRPLAEALGRTEAMEVYLRIFGSKAGRMLVYNEASGAFHARAQSEQLTSDLGALLVRLCGAMDLEVACYAEEDPEAQVVDLDEIEERLRRQAQSSRALWWLATVAETAMSYERARELAGPWADHVRASVAGYVVLPFLAGELG